LKKKKLPGEKDRSPKKKKKPVGTPLEGGGRPEGVPGGLRKKKNNGGSHLDLRGGGGTHFEKQRTPSSMWGRCFQLYSGGEEVIEGKGIP